MREDGEVSEVGRGKRRPLGRGEWIAIAVAVVLVGAAIFAWVWRPSQPVAPVVSAPAPGVGAPSAAPDDGPAPTVADPDARSALEALSADPAFRRWLAAADDLVRRWATATANVAEGASPRRALDVLAPRGAFVVEERGGQTVIAEASYARYDAVTGAIDSLDAAALARVYRALHPALQGAYRALGYPGASFDAATSRALARLERAPVVDGPVALTPERGVYKLADEKLEALPDVEKHLLRMGPKNARRVQAKARAIRQALQLPAP